MSAAVDCIYAIDSFALRSTWTLNSTRQLAEKLGPYETYDGSPASQGLLQFDMWGVTPSDRWDWAGLKVSYNGCTSVTSTPA